MEAGCLVAAEVVPMEQHHVVEVVGVHLESFPRYFLTCLGKRFLNLLYTEILRDPQHVAAVAVGESRHVLGFVAGVVEQEGFYRRLAKRRWLAFSLASVGALARRPSIAPRLWRALTHYQQAARAAAPALLMSLAVSPPEMGRGLGAELVGWFLDELHSREVRAVCLTTDRDHNDVTNRFYQRLGFRISREFTTPEGRVMNEYVKVLSGSKSPNPISA